MAYSGLADAYSTLSNYGDDSNDVIPKADAAAEKALELDPTLAHPHAVLGANKMQYSWDFVGGEAEFRKALELDPSDATAHQWFSESLAWMGGRAQEAIEEGNRAHQLDPLSPIIAAQQAQAYGYDRQFDKAIELYKKDVADNPNFGRAHTELAVIYWAARKYAEAVQEWKTGAQFEGDKNFSEWAAAMDEAFHSGGWQAAERKSIEVMLAQRKVHNEYVSPLSDRFGVCRSRRQGSRFRVAQYRIPRTRQFHDCGSHGPRVRFPALRSALHRTGAQNRAAAVRDGGSP